jgi:hypothetical protein
VTGEVEEDDFSTAATAAIEQLLLEAVEIDATEIHVDREEEMRCSGSFEQNVRTLAEAGEISAEDAAAACT